MLALKILISSALQRDGSRFKCTKYENSPYFDKAVKKRTT